jgi:hypothetical protein
LQINIIRHTDNTRNGIRPQKNFQKYKKHTVDESLKIEQKVSSKRIVQDLIL